MSNHGSKALPVSSARHPARAQGFTLVEILIVVVILGIIASIVIGNAQGASDESRRSVFTQNLRSFQQGITLYQNSTGLIPPQAATGTCPTELRPFVEWEHFERQTPLGGAWDLEVNASGITLGVGVHFNGTGMTRDDAYMTLVDQMLDDGDLNTGGFRKIAADRYYIVMMN